MCGERLRFYCPVFPTGTLLLFATGALHVPHVSHVVSHQNSRLHVKRELILNFCGPLGAVVVLNLVGSEVLELRFLSVMLYSVSDFPRSYGRHG